MDPKLKMALFGGASVLAMSSFGVARAQTQLPLESAVTGAEIIKDNANATGGYFTVNQQGTYARIIAGHLSVTGSSATVASCGTSPSIVGTDTAGQVTMGTGSPTTCSILFASAYVKAPFCSVDWVTNLGVFSFATTTNTIALTQTSNSSSVVNYICIGQAGG